MLDFPLLPPSLPNRGREKGQMVGGKKGGREKKASRGSEPAPFHLLLILETYSGQAWKGRRGRRHSASFTSESLPHRKEEKKKKGEEVERPSANVPRTPKSIIIHR